MDDGVDPVLCDQFGDARLISSVADQKRRARRHRPIEAGREISSTTTRSPASTSA
jgi:hypothetical protein